MIRTIVHDTSDLSDGFVSIGFQSRIWWSGLYLPGTGRSASGGVEVRAAVTGGYIQESLWSLRPDLL